MFNNVFKKKTTSNKEIRSSPPKTISKDLNESQTAEQDITLEVEEVLDKPAYAEEVENLILDEELDIELNLSDNGEVDDIDEEELRENLTNSIKDELMREATTIQEIEEKAENLNEHIGITQVEWDTTYNNVELVGYENRQKQVETFEKVLPKEFDVHTHSVLDVGCGVGDLWAYCTDVLNSQNLNYVGIDSDITLIELGKKKYPEISNKLYNSSNIDFKIGEQYDWVIANSTFGFTTNQELYTEINNLYGSSIKGTAFNIPISKYNIPELIQHLDENYNDYTYQKNYIKGEIILHIYK